MCVHLSKNSMGIGPFDDEVPDARGLKSIPTSILLSPSYKHPPRLVSLRCWLVPEWLAWQFPFRDSFHWLAAEKCGPILVLLPSVRASWQWWW